MSKVTTGVSKVHTGDRLLKSRQNVLGLHFSSKHPCRHTLCSVALLLAYFVFFARCASAQPPPPAPASIRVLTWNVQNLRPEEDTPLHIQAIALTILKDAPPDILFLQEVSSRKALDDLNKLLTPRGYRTVLFAEPEKESAFSVAILSRYPVFGYPQTLPLIAVKAGVTRPAIVATLVLPHGGLVKVATTHLPARPEQARARSELLSELSSWLAREEATPTIVGGDFNLSWEELSNEPKVRALFQHGTIALPSPLNGPPGTFYFGPGKTWSLPDVIFSINRLATLEATSMSPTWWAQMNDDYTPRKYNRISASGVSDHFPLRATFQVAASDMSIDLVQKKGLSLPIPEGRSLDEFLRVTLAPRANELIEKDIIFTEKYSDDFFSRLAPGSLDLMTVMGLPRPGSPALHKLLQDLAGRSLILSGPQLKLSDEDTRGRPNELGNGELSILGRIFQYDQDLFIRASSPDAAREWWFFPISRHNLRSYTSVGSLELRDLAYSQLCLVLERLRIPTSEAWLEFLSEGYMQRIRALPEQVQEALFEVGGIYLAEQFKRIPLALPFDEKPWMSGSNTSALLLLHDYFSSGGPGIFAKTVGDSLTLESGPASCTTYQLDYRKQRCARLSLETGISDYIKAHHPRTFQALASETGCDKPNLFECLNRVFDRDTRISKNLQKLFSEMLRLVGHDRAKIAQHILEFSRGTEALEVVRACEGTQYAKEALKTSPL